MIVCIDCNCNNYDQMVNISIFLHYFFFNFYIFGEGRGCRLCCDVSRIFLFYSSFSTLFVSVLCLKDQQSHFLVNANSQSVFILSFSGLSRPRRRNLKIRKRKRKRKNASLHPVQAMTAVLNQNMKGA